PSVGAVAPARAPGAARVVLDHEAVRLVRVRRAVLAPVRIEAHAVAEAPAGPEQRVAVQPAPLALHLGVAAAQPGARLHVAADEPVLARAVDPGQGGPRHALAGLLGGAPVGPVVAEPVGVAVACLVPALGRGGLVGRPAREGSAGGAGRRIALAERQAVVGDPLPGPFALAVVQADEGRPVDAAAHEVVLLPVVDAGEVEAARAAEAAPLVEPVV